MSDISQKLDQYGDYYDHVVSFGRPTQSPDEVRRLLARHDIKATERAKDNGVQFDLAACPFCGQTEGNPAIGVKDRVAWFRCFREKAGCSTKTYADFVRRLESPSIVSAADLVSTYTTPRPDVIRGILRQGDVCNLIGGPKAKKSWMVSLMAICVANGIPWLGHPTVKGNVLVVDNELHRDDLAFRGRKISSALGAGLDGVDIMQLRGRLPDIHRLRDELKDVSGKYSLIICDALYKFLGGIDENSNGAMTMTYATLDQIASQTGSAVGVIHHLSKGSQKTKSTTDLGAGAGAQSRSADVHLALRDHEEENAVVLEGVLRSQPPIKPLCLEWQYPLWRVAPDKDPANVAVTSNRKASPTMEAFLATLPTDPQKKTEVLAFSKKSLGAAKTAIDLLAAEAIKRGLAVQSRDKNPTSPYMLRRA